jgi:hypothetical protein
VNVTHLRSRSQSDKSALSTTSTKGGIASSDSSRSGRSCDSTEDGTTSSVACCDDCSTPRLANAIGKWASKSCWYEEGERSDDGGKLYFGRCRGEIELALCCLRLLA